MSQSWRPKYVRGSGGGKSGGQGRVAKEDPDSLSSRQLAKLKEALSEGEIFGFADPDHPLRCIALDDTPIENPDGSLNFRNFDFYFLPGSQEQSFLPGFNAEEGITPINVEVKQATPWTRRVTDGSIDAVRIDVRFPRLQKQDKTNGDIHGTSVRVKIAVQSNDGGFVDKIDDTIKGKASNPYVRGYRIDLSGLTPPWDIRVTRVTADAPDEATQDASFVASITEITYGKLRHPNTALIGINIDAEQFGSIPRRAYKMKGLIIKVPTNYDPIARTYADSGPGTTMGTWDGTFKLAWTNNPAWCYYDMATHPRYGLGNYLPEAAVNKWELYSIAQYCDELVPDGHGGMEPRFTCHIYLQKRNEAMQVLSDMASVFRGMHYFANGVLNPVQDRPRDPDFLFSPANVVNGFFAFVGTGQKTRHTAAVVGFNNPDNFSLGDSEPYEDHDAILRYGYNPLIFTAFGCQSRMQARRAGKWAITAEKLLTDTVLFTAGQEGMEAKPGKICSILAPFRSGADFSGRIKAASATELQIDREIELLAGVEYYVSFNVNDPALPFEQRVHPVVVLLTNGPGVTDLLTFAAQALLPLETAMWQVKGGNVQPELFRILNATPRDRATIDILALKHVPSLYDHIDDDFPLEDPTPSALPNPGICLPPGVITLTPVTVSNPISTVTVDLHISWVASPDRFLRGYQAHIRQNQGNWMPLPESPATEAILENVLPGIYEVLVVAVNRFGKTSPSSSGSVNVGNFNPLEGATVTGLEIVGQGNVTDFSTRDVQFAWRINSPTMAAQEVEDDARFDPYFQNFEVTIYNADTGAVLQPTIPVTQPTYTHTLENNVASGGPYPRYKIGVRIRDRWNNLSAEAFLTVNKLPPLPAIAPDNVLPTVDGVIPMWTTQADSSRVRFDIWMDTILDGAPIASTSADSSQKAIIGITGPGMRFFWVQAVDCYGLKSTFLELGWAQPGGVNSIAPVQFMPDGGAVDNLGLGVSNVHLAHVDPAAEIWFRVNDPGSIPTNITAEGNVKYFDGLLAINPPDSGATFTARALVNGQWGPVDERVFILNPSGGGGGGGPDTTIAPIFDPTPGAYEDPTGQLDISFGYAAVDAIFYTKTINGSEPPDPTHDGSGNPTGTTIKVAADSVALTLDRGITKFKAISVKAGLNDSAIAQASYSVRKTVGVPL